MSSPSRNKGTRFESLVTDYLQHYFPHAERRALAGNADAGDIAGIHDLVVQCKDRQNMSLGAWLDDAHAQADIADVTFGVVAHKRRGVHAAGAQFITMSVEDFARMYHLLLELEHRDITKEVIVIEELSGWNGDRHVHVINDDGVVISCLIYNPEHKVTTLCLPDALLEYPGMAECIVDYRGARHVNDLALFGEWGDDMVAVTIFEDCVQDRHRRCPGFRVARDGQGDDELCACPCHGR